MDVSIMAVKKGSTMSAHMTHKVKHPISNRIVHLVVDQRPQMALSSEVVSERQTGLILASIVTEAMSTQESLWL